MKLIDADRLPLRKFQEQECKGLGEGAAYRQGWNDAIDAIMNNEPQQEYEELDFTQKHERIPVMLTILPQKKQGTWIKENIVLTSNPPQYQWHCSECGKVIYGYSAEILTNFCPSCGADMRRGQDENDRR